MLIGRWFVMFIGAERRKHLVDWLSPLAFQHCCAFAYDARAKRWLIYDVSREGTTIVALAPEALDEWIGASRRAGARVLVIDRADGPRAWLQIGMWCTVGVRHLIGGRSRALRPIGLWRDLLAAGAREAFVEERA